MPKLRKMLGRADMPVCLALMRLLDTQSRRTVAGWAIRITSEVCLPVYEAHSPQGPDLRADVQDCARCAAEGGRPAAVKPQLRALAQIARVEKDPVAQSAARAIATACAALQTPTGALGACSMRRPPRRIIRWELRSRQLCTTRRRKSSSSGRWPTCRTMPCPTNPTRSG